MTAERANVVIVGAGQAGLALSHELCRAGVAHTVLERGRVGETWRGRWNSFCLVLPNWTVQLPGYRYADDPDGFMPRDEIVAHLADYVRWVRLPQAFDELGFPIQRDGSSPVVSGLHFMGVHFQRKRKSATFLGVAEDAAVLAERIASAAH